ncbi:MAG: mannose-1-phosphate guanylyltransferase [Planctomycetota bacterium]
MIHAVVMAGGAGTRFWPESRAGRPKQLLNLAGERTMIQATVDRLGEMASSVMVVTNERLVEAMRAQLPQVPADSIIGEPCKRDTAPCVGLAAIWLLQQDPEAIMVVMPADHVITTDEQFQFAMRAATQIVEADAEQIVTFGIRPTYPAESFGYIERDQPYQPEIEGVQAFQVKQFREKPNADVAQAYLASGNFYWNSGIFVWKAGHIVDQLRTHEPEMMRHLDKIGETIGTSDFADTFVREFEAINGKSIDYAVMERAEKVTVIEAPFTWDDVGSWQSLSRLHPQDADGNTVVAKHLGLDSEGCIVRGDPDHLIVTIGLKDCIVVHTDSATLVASKDREESVREVVKRMQEKDWSEYL